MSREYRILVVEDNQTDAELMERELRKGGITFSSRCVMTEKAFSKEIEDFAPDIILSDYRLPAFNGLSALAIAKQKYPDIPFIMISGTLGDDLAVETLRKGATDYILKDRLARLVPAVGRALRESERVRIEKEMETHIQALEIQNKELRERELKIKKLQVDLEHLREQLSEISDVNYTTA